MEAKELRIGNIFNAKVSNGIETLTIYDVKVFEILKDGLRDINGLKFGFDNLEEIPLTEEWLLRFGFEKDEDYFSFGNFHYYLPTGAFYIGNDHVSSGHDDGKIEFVHQLQNLYFALTGKELTIN